jgi:DNA-binding winged helix-turn-helix (wHTH) protein
MRVEIGGCTFDSESRELTREDAPIALTPKAFALLEALVEQHPAAVSKKDLYAKLWPGVFVEEGNLHTLVSEIRTAIGDQAHEIVVTKQRFGYAIASLQRHDRALAHLVIGSLDVPLHAGETVIGRDLIGTPDVSRRHARIVVSEGSITIEDLSSKNGTWLSGRRITSATLHDGAELILGRTRAILRISRDEETLTADPPVSESSE